MMIRWRVLVIAFSLGIPTHAIEQSGSYVGRDATDDQLAPLASELRVPKNIPIPSDIPSYEIVQGKAGEKSIAVFEVRKYHKAYFESWNEQLYQYGFLNLSCDVRAHMSLLTSLKSDRYWGRGVHEGKVDCFARIEQLRKTHGDAVTHRAARLAYVEVANADLTFVRSLGDADEVRDASIVTALDVEFVPTNTLSPGEQRNDRGCGPGAEGSPSGNDQAVRTDTISSGLGMSATPPVWSRHSAEKTRDNAQVFEGCSGRAARRWPDVPRVMNECRVRWKASRGQP